MQNPTYLKQFDQEFLTELKSAVGQEIEQIKSYKQSRKTHFKGIFLVVFFISCLMLMYNSSSAISYLIFAVILGVTCLPLILNIGHEAVHNVFSENKVINNLGRRIFDILGTSSYFWELRHISSHHAYANVKDWDLDIEQSKIIRLSSYQKHKKHHRFQHLYMPIAFCFYTIIWFFIRDFTDIKKKKFGTKNIERHPIGKIILLFISKLFHICLLIIIPLLITKNFLLVFSGFLLFHLAASIATTFALISTHVGINQEIVSPNDSVLPYSWAQHQLRTTADFSTNSRFMLHFFGGFNHHVAHHFFPKIQHIYYPRITPIIKKLANTHQIPYNSYNNLIECAGSHLKRLKKHSTT